MPMLTDVWEAEVIDTTDFSCQMRRNSRHEYGGKQRVCRNMEFQHKAYTLETIELHIMTIQKVYNQCMKLKSLVLAEVAV